MMTMMVLGGLAVATLGMLFISKSMMIMMVYIGWAGPRLVCFVTQNQMMTTMVLGGLATFGMHVNRSSKSNDDNDGIFNSK